MHTKLGSLSRTAAQPILTRARPPLEPPNELFTSTANVARRSHLAYTRRGPIEYTLSGRGGACLVLHGGHGNCFTPCGAEEAFRAGLRVLQPSRPGYGRTPAEVGQTADEAADAVIELLDTLSVPEVSLIAISAGGPTALSLAARYPARVRRLVLESAVTRRWHRASDPAYKAAKWLLNPVAEKLTWPFLRRLWRLSPETVLLWTLPSFSALPPREVLATLGAAERAAFGEMLYGMASGSGFMLDLGHDVGASTLGAIRAPTLIVHSPYDSAVPFAHAEYARAHIAGARLLEAPTAGHLLWLGGNGLIDQVAAFLSHDRFPPPS